MKKLFFVLLLLLCVSGVQAIGSNGLFGFYFPVGIGNVLHNDNRTFQTMCLTPDEILYNVEYIGIIGGTTGSPPTYRLGFQQWNGTAPNRTWYGGATNYNISTTFTNGGVTYRKLPLSFNVSAGTTICIVPEYQNGTIDASNRLITNIYNRFNSSFNASGPWYNTMEDWRVFSATTTNNNTFAITAGAGAPFLIGNASHNFSNPFQSDGLNAANFSDGVTMKFYVDDGPINLSDTATLTMRFRTTATAASCAYRVMLVNLTNMNSSWLSYAVAQFPYNVTSASVNLYTSTINQSVVLNNDSYYNLVLYKIDDITCRINYASALTQATSNGPLSFQGNTGYSETTANNWSTKSTVFATDHPFWLTNSSMATGGGGDTCTYGGAGDWTILGSDNCVISTTVNLLGNSVTCTGAGSLTITGMIRNFVKTRAISSCRIRAVSGGKLTK